MGIQSRSGAGSEIREELDQEGTENGASSMRTRAGERFRRRGSFVRRRWDEPGTYNFDGEQSRSVRRPYCRGGEGLTVCEIRQHGDGIEQALTAGCESSSPIIAQWGFA